MKLDQLTDYNKRNYAKNEEWRQVPDLFSLFDYA